MGTHVGKILRPMLNPSNGRLHVVLCLHGKQRYCYVHLLVLKAFIGPRPPEHDAHHINENPLDNRPVNLRWEPEGPHRSKGQQGERNTRARLTEADVHEIRARAKRGCRQCDLAVLFDVHRTTISHVVRRNTWKHI